MSGPIRNPARYRWHAQTKDSPAMIAACERKSRYGTERDARRVGRDRLALEVREGGSRAKKLWCYACAVCRKWHLTSVETKCAAITHRELWEGTGL